MTRSKWKGPYFKINLLYKLMKTLEAKTHKPIKIWSRSSTILREFIDQDFEVHNGNRFIKVRVSKEMVGHKFGEFASTRRYALKKKKKGKK